MSLKANALISAYKILSFVSFNFSALEDDIHLDEVDLMSELTIGTESPIWIEALHLARCSHIPFWIINQ